MASTESRRQQNVGGCAEASLYCFGPAKSAAADFSQTSLMFSYFSLKMLYSSCAVTKSAVAAGRPAFMGGLSLTLYGLICTGPPCRNVTNIGVDKISAPAKISLIFFKHSSQYLCSQACYQKLVNAKSNHHHCLISVFILITSKLRPSQRSNAEISECSNGVGPMGGGGG